MSHETTGIEYLFQDQRIHLDERVRDLVSRLTLEEKIESMLQYQPAIDRLGVAAYKHGTEAAHGIAWLGEATSFPQPVGLACTWDTELMRQIGSVIADEARVYYRRDPMLNGLTLWAPTVDMERDPRWGRNEEAYGEEVVQLYVRPGASRVKRPLKILCGFHRIRLEPGETRTVSFTIRVKDWAIWDVTKDRYCVEAGEYTLLAGASSADIRLEYPVNVRGEVIPPRQTGQRIRAENFDDCSNILLDESKEQKEAYVRPYSPQRPGWIAFHGVVLDTTDAVELQCRVSGNSSNAAIELRLDTPDNAAVARMNVGNTGGAQAWITLSEALGPVSGSRDVYLWLSGEVRLSHFTLSTCATGGSRL